MAKVAVEQIFNGTIAEGTSYDSTRITIPPVPTTIRQWDLGSGPDDKFVGPNPVVVLRPIEASTSIPAGYVYVLQWSTTQWWVFYSDNASAAATRRIGLYYFNPVTNIATWRGFITLTYPTATNHTIRGFRMARTTYTTGTVAVSGTAVTGTGTLFQTNRIATGSRIGFGTTDPNAVTTWYEISAITSETAITLTTSAGTIASGTPYVIEELRAITANTNATAANGGLFVTKGLRIENFTPTGTTIAAAVSTDNVRAVFWLRDSATVTNTLATGLAMDEPASLTSHNVYVPNGNASSLTIYRYNIRAALTVSGGGATLSGSDLTVTGAQTVTGTISQNGNGRVDTLSHGPGAGIKSIYLVTTTRIIRIATSAVITGSTTFISDQMTENPPGGTTTYALFNAFNSVEVVSSIDRLVVSNGAAARHYVTQYRTDAGQMDDIFLVDSRQLDQGSASSASRPHPNTGQSTAAPAYFWAEGGFMFYVKQATAATTGQIYVWPVSCHWTYASTNNQRVIFPAINLGSTPSKFYRVYCEGPLHLGSNEFGKTLEPYRLLYRTSGIVADTGSWTQVPSNGDLSGVSAASQIQFAAEFKAIGDICIPGRISSICFLYETNDALPSQYRWNFSDFDTSTGVFAWIQVALFSSLTTHTINIYRADTDALVLSQTSPGGVNGDFQYWNGSAWTNGLGTNTVDLRRRFLPTASLPSGVRLYATVTVA